MRVDNADFPAIFNKITENKKYVLSEIKSHKYFLDKFHKIWNNLKIMFTYLKSK